MRLDEKFFLKIKDYAMNLYEGEEIEKYAVLYIDKITEKIEHIFVFIEEESTAISAAVDEEKLIEKSHLYKDKLCFVIHNHPFVNIGPSLADVVNSRKVKSFFELSGADYKGGLVLAEKDMFYIPVDYKRPLKEMSSPNKGSEFPDFDEINFDFLVGEEVIVNDKHRVSGKRFSLSELYYFTGRGKESTYVLMDKKNNEERARYIEDAFVNVVTIDKSYAKKEVLDN